MTTFIEMHALRSFPPSNLNRDDLGSPKTAVFGGSRRLRISSQCLKRTWRMSEHFRGAFAEDQLGIRSNRLPDEVLKVVKDDLDQAARDGLMALLGSIGRKGAAPAAPGDEEGADDAGSTAQAEGTGTETRTAHLLFLSRQEIESVSEFARSKKADLGKVLKKGKPDSKAIERLRKDLREHLEYKTAKNAVDVGLFGRFVTSDEFDTIDGALQVAHALGTQKIEIEYDYFTAVDDLGDEPGAGHLGETEFASSVLYLYACCDLAQLATNLGPRGEAGRRADGEAHELACRSLPALVRAMAEATPKGKKNGTAPHTPAEYVEVVVRRGAPLSLANAFLKPVDPREEGGDVMAASIQRLETHRDRVEEAYGRSSEVLARFVLRVRGDAETGDVKTINVLSDELAKKLKAMPAQAAQ